MGGLGRSVVLVAVLTAIAGCEAATGPEAMGQCVAVVNVDGTIFTFEGETMAADFEPGQLVMTVSTLTDCNDTVVGDEPPLDNEVAPGESNFLPEGTPIYTVPGQAPDELLAAETEDGWLALVPDPSA